VLLEPAAVDRKLAPSSLGHTRTSVRRYMAIPIRL